MENFVGIPISPENTIVFDHDCETVIGFEGYEFFKTDDIMEQIKKDSYVVTLDSEMYESYHRANGFSINVAYKVLDVVESPNRSIKLLKLSNDLNNIFWVDSMFFNLSKDNVSSKNTITAKYVEKLCSGSTMVKFETIRGGEIVLEFDSDMKVTYMKA